MEPYKYSMQAYLYQFWNSDCGGNSGNDGGVNVAEGTRKGRDTVEHCVSHCAQRSCFLCPSRTLMLTLTSENVALNLGRNNFWCGHTFHRVFRP